MATTSMEDSRCTTFLLLAWRGNDTNNGMGLYHGPVLGLSAFCGEQVLEPATLIDGPQLFLIVSFLISGYHC